MQTTHEVAWLNALDPDSARRELLKCCGSRAWAEEVEQSRPFASVEQLIARANEVWWTLQPSDWLEAFRSHPKIGERKPAGAVSPQSQQWSSQEQQSVQHAASGTIDRLARLNADYEQKFGFIFIVCATGKSSDEILALLESRIENDPAAELRIAAAEQAKITDLRLRKLLVRES